MAFSRQYDYLKNGYENSDSTDWSKVGAAVAYPFSQIKKGATDIDPLLQLGLVNAIWGDNSVLNMYNANQEAEKNRELQEKMNAALNKADSGSSIEKALDKKENQKRLDEVLYPQLRTAMSKVYRSYNNNKKWQDVDELDWAELDNAWNAVKKLGGDDIGAELYLAHRPVKVLDDNNGVDDHAETGDNRSSQQIKDDHATALKAFEVEKSKLKPRAQNKNYDDEYKALQSKYDALAQVVQANPTLGLSNPSDMPKFDTKKPPKTMKEQMKNFVSGLKNLKLNKETLKERLQKKFPNASEADINDVLN